ncbi:4'-phosphopantetheinyl transferase superfamily protein [Cyanobium sp. AMD-g]|uniref:4'-phosphopantetheinyl transferase family protein n=1 Tax=Cyanobium sp. AMD-g TaxID=2823699 RepID=UPI0020CF48E4|nr:4'-phosphopantetheinyl transferase superfamily protein [Cyanobium sp. AMD-g]MCP9931040.1 4'-phosphopantetheinyl transferase superfamily protein [Cyanobium sp. AMD-g]
MQCADSPVHAAIAPAAWPDPGGSLERPPWPSPGPDAAPLLLLLDQREPQLQALVGPLGDLLDPGERQRLRLLRRQEDGQRFLLARGALRQILGCWLGCDPAGLVLGAGPHGKPELFPQQAAGPGREGLPPQFNVSHSGDLILLGFHPLRPVGVDLEQRRPLPEWQGIARRCLPPGAVEAILALPEERRGDAFLAAWCRLEAGLKARGLGLFAGARTDGRAREGPDHWPVLLPEGYVGAAALA